MVSHANRLDCDVNTFLEEFKELEKEDRFVGIFLSGLDSATGKYWCPDCVEADKVLTNVVDPLCKSQNIKAIFVNVGDKPTWKSPDHPLRTNPTFAITGVPTLALFEHGKLVQRLVEYDIDEENVRNLLVKS